MGHLTDMCHEDVIDIICEECGNVVVGRLRRSLGMTNAEWARAKRGALTGYTCEKCGSDERSPPWWPNEWWPWPAPTEAPIFWPDDLAWPPEESAIQTLRGRLRGRSSPPGPS